MARYAGCIRNRSILVGGILLAAVGSLGHARAAVIGVLSDDRQAAFLSILGASSAQARTQIQADGHEIVTLNSLSINVMQSVDVVWLPVLDVFKSYTAQERTNIVQFVYDGGHVVFIGDADVFNSADNSFLTAFGLSKRTGNLNAALSPVLPDHPVITGPYGAVSLVGRNAGYGLFNSAANVADVFVASSGVGAFAGFLEPRSGYAGAGRLAIICDASIFGQLLDQDDHRVYLRNTVAWAVAAPGYTPSGTDIELRDLGPIGEIVSRIDIQLAAVTGSGFTTLEPIGRGRCGFEQVSNNSLPDDFLGEGFHVTTTAALTGDVELTVNYDTAALTTMGIVDEGGLMLLRLDSNLMVLLDITTGRNAAENTITGRSNGLGTILLGARVSTFEDCNGNGRPDECEPNGEDCNTNGVADVCEVFRGTVPDCDGNGIPDVCDPDCTSNGIPDACDINVGREQDCDANRIPDDCDFAGGTAADCDSSGIPDSCEIDRGSAADCNTNHIPDECDLTDDDVVDCNSNGVPDRCDVAGGSAADCDDNGKPDDCDADCDGNGTPDSCDLIAHRVPDCNHNSVPDSCDLASGFSRDCNSSGVPDSCDIAEASAPDCNTDGRPDVCDIAEGRAADCNSNGVPDRCDIASGAAADCNRNNVPDHCDITRGTAADCNSNQMVDTCELTVGSSADCNTNRVPDSCELAGGTVQDCNTNGVPDRCDIAAGGARDCDGNGTPDPCDMSAGAPDCNADGVPDSCDISRHTSTDCNTDRVPDDCEPDCDGNNVADACEIAWGLSQDCNQTEIPDGCEIVAGSSEDCDGNSIPDECDPDCNGNGIPDACDVVGGPIEDCDHNGIPDECDLAANRASDCNGNGMPDACEIVADGRLDCNSNGVPDECDPDCDDNGVPDSCELTRGLATDCNFNHVPDGCDIAAGTAADCDSSGTLDNCDIAGGRLIDCDRNRVPDVCDLSVEGNGDCNSNGRPDRCDIGTGVSPDCNRNGIPDECEPPYVADAGAAMRLCVGQNSPPLGGPVVAEGSRPPYQYMWRVVAGPSGGGQVIEPTAQRARFTASRAGEYVVEVVVSDSTSPSCTTKDTVTITVADFSIRAESLATMCGGGTSSPLASTVSGGVPPFSYRWSVDAGSVSRAAAQFTGTGAASPSPTFTPDGPGPYTLRVTVTDSNSPPCEASAATAINVVQMSIATGADFNMCVGGESATLAVTVISPGTPPLSYEWSVALGSPNTDISQFGGDGPRAANPTFRPNSVGFYTIVVYMRDSSSPPCTSAASMRVSVGTMAVNAGADVAVCTGSPGMRLAPTLTGGLGELIYSWTVEPGSPSTDSRQFVEPHGFAASPLFKPAAAGTYSLKVTVQDAGTPACTATDTIVIRATGLPADAGRDMIVKAREASPRLGRESISAVSGALAYRWRVVGGAATDASQFSDPADPHPTFTPKQVGTYLLELKLTDAGAECSTLDEVVLEAVTAADVLNVNSDGRVFMSLQLDEPHERAEVRVSQAPPGPIVRGELVEDDPPAILAGRSVSPLITRRVVAQSELSWGKMAVVVAMYYGTSEMPEGEASAQRLLWLDTGDNRWKQAGGRLFETGGYPVRAEKADVGRHGHDAKSGCVWVVTDHLGDFTIGVPDAAAVPPAAGPAGTPQSSTDGGAAAAAMQGLCGMAGGGVAMSLLMMAGWKGRRGRRIRGG